jgi:hypothetical protein
MIRTPVTRRSIITSLSESPLITRLRQRLGGSLQEPPPETADETDSELPAPATEDTFTDNPDQHDEPVTGVIIDAPQYDSNPVPLPNVFTPSQLRSDYVESVMEEIEKSLPRPLIPTPAHSPEQRDNQNTSNSDPHLEPTSTANPNLCPVCLEDISLNRKAIMCNFCKCWHHRACLHPSFTDKDITTVKKDFVILICQNCSEQKLHLLSCVPHNPTTASISKETQCDLLLPPTNPPIADIIIISKSCSKTIILMLLP